MHVGGVGTHVLLSSGGGGSGWCGRKIGLMKLVPGFGGGGPEASAADVNARAARAATPPSLFSLVLTPW